MYPQLEIHLDRIRQNLDAVCRITKEEGHCKRLAIVTKGVCADPEIVKIIVSEPRVDYVADSRVKNIASYADLAHEKGRKTMLLRIPMPSELIEVVRYVDLCQISELQTIRLLNREAEKAGQPLAVELEPLLNFASAEEYHQKYLEKNPGGYCHVPQRLMHLAEEEQEN